MTKAACTRIAFAMSGTIATVIGPWRGKQTQQHSDPVVAAIERVLKTERDGVEALRRSEEHARDLLAQARAQAAAIAAPRRSLHFEDCTPLICKKSSARSQTLDRPPPLPATATTMRL